MAQVQGIKKITIDQTSSPVNVNDGNPLNGKYTVQFTGDFNGANIYIKASLDQDENFETITNSSLSAVTFTSTTVVTIDLHGYVQVSADTAVPSVDVLFAPVSQS